MWTRQAFVETLLDTPKYGDERKASYAEATKIVEEMDKLQPGFRAEDGWKGFQALLASKLDLSAPKKAE
jgi:hypothetical protein